MQFAQPAYKVKSFPLALAFPSLGAFLQRGTSILAINWLMQGVRGMQRKELSFRLTSEMLVICLMAALLRSNGLGLALALTTAFGVAHTVNFTLNGQFWVAARYCRWFTGSGPRLHRFLGELAALLHDRSWLQEAVVIGSAGCRPLSDRSDIDLRLIFPSGIGGWLRTNVLLLRLRAGAFLRGFPLDLYAYDSVDALDRFDQREPLVIVLDRQGRVARRYAARDLGFLP